MRYLVFSDIHSDEEAFRKLLKIMVKLKCDCMVSAGDFCPTVEMEVDAYNLGDFRTVMGNCDRYHEYSILSTPREFISFKDGERTVTVTHGDCYGASHFSLRSGDIFISGHTHRSALERDGNGIILFNPGSVSRPRDGRKSFGVIAPDGIELLSFPLCLSHEKLMF